MGDVIVKQSITLIVAKNPAQAGAAIVEKDLESLNSQIQDTTMSEGEGSRVSLAASASAVVIPMGTVAAGKLLYVNVDRDIQLALTNGLGTSQLLTFKGGRESILWLTFTGIAATNPSATDPVKGKIMIVGD